jgi:hypothetical protein
VFAVKFGAQHRNCPLQPQLDHALAVICLVVADLAVRPIATGKPGALHAPPEQYY